MYPKGSMYCPCKDTGSTKHAVPGIGLEPESFKWAVCGPFGYMDLYTPHHLPSWRSAAEQALDLNRGLWNSWNSKVPFKGALKSGVKGICGYMVGYILWA